MATDAAPADFREDIDRKQLRAVQLRFRAISAARLERVRSMLPERHRRFIDLLPLLLHGNHPALPGYVNHHTPCGIPGYRPDAAVLALARSLARSFNSRVTGGAGTGVDAVYLMGSPGTLGHSDASDIDVWICYPEQLDSAALTLLQRKTGLLQAWARELGLEAHLFLMNGAKFRRGQREPLTGENCGSAQHYLLLDEFYRTGVLLAGRHPAWWLVPPAQEASSGEYTDELLRRRLLRAGELVDFGGIHAVPAGEFLGAGIWQLYKAIDSPYKSVLKLLLFEVYASCFPQTECLSGDYKLAVYRGITDIDELDPYLMIYRRLEGHLLHVGQPERLELVRRCLYYKAGKKLSRAPQHGAPSWQRLLMQRMTAEWGWDRDKLALLDSRSDWSIHEVGTERNALVKELTYSYRYLTEFARLAEADASIDAREFSILGRKLYAAHERRAGKIELLNPGGAASVAESELSICVVSGADTTGERLWGAYPGLIGARGIPEGRPLREAACLSELLAWCVLNRVIGEHTRFALREQQDGFRYSELEAMLRDIRATLLVASTTATVDDAAFAVPATPLALLVFINVAADPLAQQRDLGLQRISSRTDSFGYSALRENLVRNVEILLCNSWGETVATRYAGESGVIRCLREYIQLALAHTGAPLPPVHMRCHSPSRAAAIAARVDELFTDLDRCFRDAAAARYVLQIGGRLHLLQHCQGSVESASADSAEELLELLATAPAEWSPLVIDRHALEGTPLPAIAPLLAPGQVAVFCEHRREGTLVLVADESSALFHMLVPGLREQSALAALAQFLAAVRYRQDSAGEACAPPVAARFYRLEHAAGGNACSVHPLREPGAASSAQLQVQALAEPGEDDDVSFSVYCDGVAFSERALGAAFGRHIAQHIRTCRPSGDDYPVYITDLDLSALKSGTAGRLRTVHYLQHRYRLERTINAALRG